MRYTLYSIGLLSLVFGCASSTTFSANRIKCDPLAGWAQVADAAEGRILWFGELHGTTEGPRRVFDYICAAAQRGGRTLVALEYPADEDGALEAGLQSATPEETWLQSVYWRIFWNDGRRSEAMLKLMLATKQLRDSGVSIDIKGIAPTPAQVVASDMNVSGWTEPLYAQNLRLSAKDYDRVIVLTGDFHTREERGTSTYDPAAALFNDAEVVSIRLLQGGGSAWFCQGEGCGPRENVPPSDLSAKVKTRSTIALSAELEPFYDGYLYIGKITASPPVVTPQ